MNEVFDLDNDALLKELGSDIAEKEPISESALNERLENDFEEIFTFFKANCRAPCHAAHYGIFERLIAVRLEKMRENTEWHFILEKLDTVGLLTNCQVENIGDIGDIDNIHNDELLAELGVNSNTADITTLRYVRSAQERKATEEIGQQTPCVDFEMFRPIFAAIAHDLKMGERITEPFKESIRIQEGDIFVLNGQFIYVAEIGKTFITKDNGESARLRIIYENATQSNILMHSLVRALYKDKNGRRVRSVRLTHSDMPLFLNTENDVVSGTIYVLRSHSNHPTLLQNRELIHKIGVTSGSVEKRIANAANEATYLLAEVEIVQTYQLHHINPIQLENLLHRVFQSARLNIEIPDRFGKIFKPQEWFLVPLHAIDEAVKYIQDGCITDMVYNTQLAKFVEIRNLNT